MQRLFEKWKLDGSVAQKNKANNFLHFDFLSIGANKSEKFMWTKIKHNSEISKEGTVINNMKITRNHALRENEINELLGTNLWSENVRALLDEELLWTLGAGQNRTMIRVNVPRNAELISQENPSGDITESISNNNEFKIFNIPSYVLPGEKIDIKFSYKTKINDGSHNWRPYYLQMSGTPAREKTSFLSSISTKESGNFSAETYNIGRPVDLINQEFRAVINFN